MSNVNRQILLACGRKLGFAEYGDPGGRPLLYCHGFPSSRLEAAFCHFAAQRLGIRIISVDRPGYGLSDFEPRRRLSAWPDDVKQLTEALGIERFGVLGVSGGGPYALACAWKMPEKLRSVKIVCSLAPLTQPETLRAMRWHTRLAFGLARRSYALLWLTYGSTVGTAIRVCPEIACGWQWLSGSPADRATLARSEVHALMQANLRESLRAGVRGALWDAVIYVRDWGFPLDQIQVPVEIWHGEADTIVPPWHCHVLAGALANGRVRLVAGEGHYSLPIEHCENILEG